MNNNQKYILLVEDNTVAIKVGSIILQGLGCKVDVATNGKMAVEMAIKNNYDLISMDIGLPIMDGVEACRKIREYENKHPERIQVPIVAVSANTGKEEIKQYITAGMQHVISKPFDKARGEELLTFCIK